MKVLTDHLKNHPQRERFDRHGINLTSFEQEVTKWGVQPDTFIHHQWENDRLPLEYKVTIMFQFVRNGFPKKGKVEFIRDEQKPKTLDEMFDLLFGLALQAKSMSHELKCDPEYFREVVAGHKRFELRLNDRDFQIGDTLILREFDRMTKTYSGEEHNVRVDYVLQGHVFGLPENYCVMSIS